MRAALALVALALASACAAPSPPGPPPPAPVATPVAPAKQNLFLLLPDPTAQAGAITVSNAGGTRELSQPGEAVRVPGPGEAPTAPFAMDAAAVQRVFGEALAAQPTPPVRVLLYFREGSDELLPDSRALLPDVLRVIRERRSADVSVVGHTDTVADREFNYRLGLRRAERVSQLLQSLGVDAAILFVSSHGEDDPLVKTADGVAEPRNRRVEVTVR